jgi:hypothetical protein
MPGFCFRGCKEKMQKEFKVCRSMIDEDHGIVVNVEE